MRNLPEDKQQNLRVAILAGITIVSFYLIFSHGATVWGYVKQLANILSPFFYGFLIALCMLPLARFFENKLLCHWHIKQRTKRKIVTLFTIIFFIAVIVFLLLLVIPEIIKAGSSIPMYVEQVSKFIEQYSQYPELYALLEWAVGFSDDVATWLINFGKTALPSIMATGYSVITITINLILGFFLTFFYLLDRERFGFQIKKILYSTVNEKQADWMLHVAKLSGKMFDKFITGKLLDSLIIGIITFITLSLFKIEYSALIAVVVGITNVIPYFGPFFGAIPCAVLLLLIDPMQCVKFLIMILIIQQFDGNILGPYILGDSVKLQPFWILFSILIFGGAFGFLGMFLGVPVFATIYAIGKELIDEKLSKKGLNDTKVRLK